MKRAENGALQRVIRYAQRWGVPVVSFSSRSIFQVKSYIFARPLDSADTLAHIGIKVDGLAEWHGGPIDDGGITYHRDGCTIYLHVGSWPMWHDDQSAPRPLGQIAPCAVLHELSHCLDCAVFGHDPDGADEVDGPMLAFEYFSTRLLRLPGRRAWMSAFGVKDTEVRHYDWCDIGTRERGQLIRASLAIAVKHGLLTTEGKPTYQRPRRM